MTSISSLRAVIYVQHLLGSGHLVRMSALADGLERKGVTVTLVSGGRPVTGLPDPLHRVIQLPPVHTRAGDFSTLLDDRGDVVDDTYRASRINNLIDAVNQAKPDVLIMETWPFGRRQMEFEIIPLLDQLASSSPDTVVISSIRDILQKRATKRRIQTLEHLRRYVSAIIVHGDPVIASLEASFEETHQINCPIFYCGYIHGGRESDQNSVDQDSGDEILVSAGGGAAGKRLLEVAVEAAVVDYRPWRILAGGKPRPATLQRLNAQIAATKGDSDAARVVIEPNRSDFRHLLRRCLVSVSQYGYNTALDLACAGCPAVVVPYAEDGETEQETRAHLFAKKSRISMLKQEFLSPATLLEAIDSVLARPPLSPGTSLPMVPDMNGADAAADRIVNFVNQLSR